jgi:hypothetical protein
MKSNVLRFFHVDFLLLLIEIFGDAPDDETLTGIVIDR